MVKNTNSTGVKWGTSRDKAERRERRHGGDLPRVVVSKGQESWQEWVFCLLPRMSMLTAQHDGILYCWKSTE